MPYLIDGNNLLYALKKSGVELARAGLCGLLAHLAAAGQRVCVVFDGPAREDGRPMPDSPHAVEVHYSASRSADDVILELIAANTAPRLLVVVSTDRKIRQAAHRRRCRIALSEDFAPLLLQAAEPAPPRKPSEPSEKYRGLSEEQTQQWLKEFHLDDETDDEDQP